MAEQVQPSLSGALPLSVAVVCKNNERTIGRALDSVAGLAAEIVAVDSGSTDGTIGLLERYRAKIVRSPWLGHIKTKQLALDGCTQPWVLCLDSDESVLADLAASIRDELSRDRLGITGYWTNRKAFYRNRALNYVWQPEWRLRLVRRGAAAWGGLDPHDALLPLDNRVACPRLAGTLRHDSFVTFAEHFRKQADHARTMAESLHGSKRSGSYVRLVVSPPGAFFKQLVLKRGFLDGYAGWLAAASTALGSMMKHGALIEMSHAHDAAAADEPERGH
jgi:hypothetical protein